MNFLKDILTIDSPSSFTMHVTERLKKEAKTLAVRFDSTKKGMGYITLAGKSNKKSIGISAHVDTLGLMVKGIKDNGRLNILKIGGMVYPSLDSELCRIYTRDGKIYNGTIFCTTPSEHVYHEANLNIRDVSTLEVILDERVNSKEEVKAIGIDHGDIIAIDTKTVITENGYIKSRFLDNKLAVALAFSIIKYYKDNNIIPKYTTTFMFPTFEEVGNGLSFLPKEFDEIIAIDMGCIGKELVGNEYSVSICAKDDSGPYDYELTTRLINLAKQNKLSYAVDVYTSYKSDVSATKVAGNDIKGALIGPGVFASHGYERSHYESIENTAKLLIQYLS